MNFTELQLDHFAAFEGVRQVGRFNMLSADAMRCAGLTRDQMLFVLENHHALECAAAAAQEARAAK